MRLTTTVLLASFLIGSVAACAASGTSNAPTDTGTKPPGSGTGTVPGTTEPKEKPLTAQPVCATIETDTSFGKGCSGTGYGEEVCALPSATCGANECVYDSRTADSFSFYCAPKCNAADTSVSCPLGYECVAPTASCAGSAEEGVCVRNKTFACVDAGDSAGTIIEGLDGALLSLKWTGTQGTLRQRTSTGWRTLTTWTDTTSYGSVYGIARSDARMLIVTSGFEILIDDGTAKATKRTTTSSYAPTVGVAADGDFVSLELSTGAYATVSRRGTDGKWTEVGPTRKRIASLAVLGKGFVARCGEDLCTSADGEAFDTLASPPDIAITETTRFVAAGASNDDFYLAVEGQLFHQRKGKWVEEGPRGQLPGTSTSSSYQDILRASPSGTVAFHTWNGSSYTTYVTKAGSECWKSTTADNLNAATLVGDSLAWTTYSQGDLCTMKIE